MLAREFGPQDRLIEASGIPRATLQRILAGKADPGPGRLEVLADALGTSVEHLTGGGDAGGSVAQVAVYDVEVAAGPGRVPFEEEPIGTWPFPADWLRREFGDRAELKLVRVAGDSQEPELRDGDSVMIDTHKPRLREGMHVVRLDDRLLLKRVQIEGATVRLKSANPSYDDVLVDLAADGETFAVVGRAVWSSKLL